MFDAFWQAYPPRHRSSANPKQPALRAWDRAIARGADPEHMVSAARQYRQECLDDGKFGTEFIPMAVTWLNQDRWDDYAFEHINAGIPTEQNPGGRSERGPEMTQLPPEAQDPRWDRIKARIRAEIGESAWKVWWQGRVVFTGCTPSAACYQFINKAAYDWFWECGPAQRLCQFWEAEGLEGLYAPMTDNIVYLDRTA